MYAGGMTAPLSATVAASFNSKWKPPIEVLDLAPVCCEAHGLPLRLDRPCFVLNNVLSEVECRALIQAAEPQHEAEPPSGTTVPGVRSQFSNDDPGLSELIWMRIHDHFPDVLDGGDVVGLETRWRHARYWPGQSVMAHMDFRHGPREDECVASRISFTLYLNDNFEGGETAFVTGVKLDGSHGGEFFLNRPRTGSAVVFYQCIPEFSHTANEVCGGCKSIMRADVLYKFKDAEAADVGGLQLR